MIVELKDILSAVVSDGEGRIEDSGECRIGERIGFELDG